MKIFDLFKSKPEPAPPVSSVDDSEVQISAGWTPLFAVSFDGQKNLGELGPILDYHLDYDGLRARSWQSYLESEITQIVMKRYAQWVIGAGLKLQAEPIKDVLESEGINVDTEKLNHLIEARFKVFSGSRESDFSRQKNLHLLAHTAYTNAIVGGDVLVLQRYVNGNLSVQLVDGAHVKTPLFNSHFHTEAKARKNTIQDGIELSPRGEHVAYFVHTGNLEYMRIPARGERSGKLMAYLVYGLEYRLNNHRGIPLISVVLETMKKLDRYKEATVGSAEERQKIPFAIEHEEFSDGENPLLQKMSKAFDASGNSDLPKDTNGTDLANTVAATTNKTIVNLPLGAKLKSMESKAELHFKEFYSTNIDLVCAAIGIPPEVALSKYDSNFSASRAALKDWEHTINMARKNFAFQFYQNFYNVWLETEILKNKIKAPGYVIAMAKKNTMALEAYHNARFVGANVPHIDPLKEVAAERMKLGDTGKSLPLTTLEAATEALNGGDSDINMEQYARELSKSLGLKIKIETPVVAPTKEKKVEED